MATNDQAAVRAAALLRFRRSRGRFLPQELFAEPAWDLLLELFIADADGQSLTGKEVAHRIGAPPSTFARWLIHLDRMGLVVGDGSGNLEDKLVPSAKALDAIERMMEEASQLFTTD